MKRSLTLFALIFLIGINIMNSQVTQKNDSINDDMEDMKEMKDMKHTEHDMSMHKLEMFKQNLNEWPQASREAVEATMKSYGDPTSSSENEFVWKDAGIWKIIKVSKMETPHNFPVEHTDMLKMTILYNVPVEKMTELGEFDGSVTFDRTQGYLSARCDLEANNFLALNLANDVITNQKTVEEARQAYADIIKEKMDGGNPEYMKKLQFEVLSANTGDPDENTTGLTKDEVMAAIKKNSKM